MTKIVSDAILQRHRDMQNNSFETFGTKVVKWRRLISGVSRYGEDTTDSYQDLTLNVLCNYNYMRSWPITNITETGSTDRQSVQILIGKDYLKSLGYLNADGYFDYDPDNDIIIMDGVEYVPKGDTPVGQDGSDDLFFSVIIQRKTLDVGKKR